MSSHIIYTIIDLKWLALNRVVFFFSYDYFDCFAFNWNMVVILKGLKAKIVQNPSSKANNEKKERNFQMINQLDSMSIDRSIDRTEHIY